MRFVIAFVCILAGANVVGWLLPAGVVDSSLNSLTEPRNPGFHRQWDSYTDVTLDGNDIVIISNSQAYGKEIDGNEVYPHLVEVKMNRKRKEQERVEVHNWGVHAGNSADFHILLAHALQQKPSLVLVILRLGNLKFYPLKSSINDTADLIDVSLAGMLPAGYIFGELGFSQVLHSVLSQQFPLLGVRDDWVERLALENDSELLLGLFRPSADLEDIRVFDQKLDDLSMNILPGMELAMRKKTYRRLYRPDISELEYIRDIFSQKDPNTRIVFALMPEERFSIHRDTVGYRQEFFEEAKTYLEKEVDQAWNLEKAVDDKFFVSYTHFNRFGHYRMANVVDFLICRMDKPAKDC